MYNQKENDNHRLTRINTSFGIRTPFVFICAHPWLRGYQDQLNSSSLLSLRAKRSNPRHHEIASAQCASQWQSLGCGSDEHLAYFVSRAWLVASSKCRVKSRAGMILVIVLAMSAALLVLGGSYLKSVSQHRPVNSKNLRQMQMEFFSQGIQRIALLKFKKFPADFYHAYIYENAFNSVPRPRDLPIYRFTPLTEFAGRTDTALNGPRTTNPPLTGSPAPIASYRTSFSLITSKRYSRDFIEINVTTTVGALVQDYKMTVEASRTTLL